MIVFLKKSQEFILKILRMIKKSFIEPQAMF